MRRNAFLKKLRLSHSHSLTHYLNWEQITDNDLEVLGKDKWVLDIHSPSLFGRNRGILERWWEYLGSWVVGRLMWRPLFLGAWVKWGTVENQCKWWNLLLSWTAYVDDHQVQVRLLMSSFETFFFFLVENIIVYLFCRVAFSLDKLGLRAVVSDCKYRKKT